MKTQTLTGRFSLIVANQRFCHCQLNFSLPTKRSFLFPKRRGKTDTIVWIEIENKVGFSIMNWVNGSNQIKPEASS